MKNPGILVIAFFVCLSAQSFALESIDIYGYFESQYMGTRLNNRFHQLYSNKLRIDLTSAISEKIDFGANFNYITYHGKTNWNILEFLSNKIATGISPENQVLYTIPFNDRNYLDNCYIRFALPFSDLTIGKQQISLGTGYVWNPTDVYNIKDVFDPTYEQPGHNSIRYDIYIPGGISVTTVYSPEESWKMSTKLFNLKFRLSHFDFHISAIESNWNFHDYEQRTPESRFFEGVDECRRLIGLSTAGEIFGLGTWVELAQNYMEKSQNFHEIVCGFDYTFDFQTYIMMEYYRNSLAKNDYQDYTLTDWIRLYTSEQKAISKDQLYMMIQHPITDLIDFGVSQIISLSDASIAFVPTLNYSMAQDVDVLFYFNINIGKSGTAYAHESGNGGLARVKLYF